MKRRNKLALLTVGLSAIVFAASSCTANFCTDVEKARIAFAIEPGVSEFYTEAEYATIDKSNAVIDRQVDGTLIYQVVRMEDETYKRSAELNEIITNAKSSGIIVPTKEYFANFDIKVLTKVKEAANLDLSSSELKQEDLEKALKDFGNLKFYYDDGTTPDKKATYTAFNNYRAINKELRNEMSLTAAATVDFENVYISTLGTVVDNKRSCITTYDKVEYGSYGTDKVTVKIDKVSWKDAWNKGGRVIEGLIVYPVAWLLDAFAIAFAGGKNADPSVIQAAYNSGTPQLLSLILVTVIVRLFIFLVTFKSTIAQKKMADLQPELAKIQQKYPNANTNQAQKQRLAQEQMQLYKKHKVNPLSQLLVLIIQFPVFIGVWGAMTGSAVLSTGSVLGLDLSASIWETLKMGAKQHPGWWTAFVLILLMSASQFFSMKIPQWIQKAKTKKVARLGKNPAQNQQNKTANIVSYVMLVMIIVMGFTLPAAMGVYWFIGAIVSMIQTVFTQVVFTGKKRKK